MTKEVAKNKRLQFKSIKAMIAVNSALSIFFTGIVLMLTVLPQVENKLIAVSEHYISDVANVIGTEMDQSLDLGETVTTDDILKYVDHVNIQGITGSYCYVVDFKGNMLYHPTSSKIGKPVENEVIKDVVADLVRGRNVENATVTYSYNGDTKYAAYYIGKNINAITVVTADRKAFVGPVYIIQRLWVATATVVLILGIIYAVYFSSKIAKNMKLSTSAVEAVASLDLQGKSELTEIVGRKDETGQIARNISTMIDSLTAIVSKIKQQSSTLNGMSSNLVMVAEKSGEVISNIEVAVNEIATGATNQANETQSATEHIIDMGNRISEVEVQTQQLTETANEMNSYTEVAANAVKELSSTNATVTESIHRVAEQVNATNVSAESIQEAATVIEEIAAQTNLLSLNASIEAARVGEAGKGFAVVASEIKKLAEQSNQSAVQIKEIIKTLMDDSRMSVDIVEEVTDIMKKQSANVKNTMDTFAQVKNGIDKSVKGISGIQSQTAELKAARLLVTDSVQNLTAIAEENAASTEETSASMVEITSGITGITNHAEQLKNIVKELEATLAQFKM